jgi:hypothetical protein
LKNLDIYHSRVAIAKLGGPIAGWLGIFEIILRSDQELGQYCADEV